MNPNAAKAGEIQRQGAGDVAVIVYRKSPATRYLKPSGYPEKVSSVLYEKN